MDLTRTLKYKIFHGAAILGSVAVVAGLLIAFQVGPLPSLLIGLSFLIPGRIQGIFWRTFFRGRRALGAGQLGQAISYFECFLDELAQNPWMKSLVWLSGAVYTRDIEVMTLNNLGAAHLQRGDWSPAEDYLKRAISRDPLCPLPFFNLAVLDQIGGRAEKAQRQLRRADELGYRRTSVDHLIHSAGAILARAEGR